jgi:hypothetical protein
MAGLDDSGVNRADRDLVHTFASHLLEGERPSVVPKIRRDGVFPEREVVCRPETVTDERAWVRMAEGRNAKEVVTAVA